MASPRRSRTLLSLSQALRASTKCNGSGGTRTFFFTSRRQAEGDVGALRAGGQAYSDAFNRREKAAEDMYVREREKTILALLREKVAKQEQILAKDKAMLAEMEDQYGHVAEVTDRA
jgi:ATPase inhibitor, mitochondrial